MEVPGPGWRTPKGLEQTTLYSKQSVRYLADAHISMSGTPGGDEDGKEMVMEASVGMRLSREHRRGEVPFKVPSPIQRPGGRKQRQ